MQGAVAAALRTLQRKGTKTNVDATRPRVEPIQSPIAQQFDKSVSSVPYPEVQPQQMPISGKLEPSMLELRLAALQSAENQDIMAMPRQSEGAVAAALRTLQRKGTKTNVDATRPRVEPIQSPIAQQFDKSVSSVPYPEVRPQQMPISGKLEPSVMELRLAALQSAENQDPTATVQQPELATIPMALKQTLDPSMADLRAGAMRSYEQQNPPPTAAIQRPPTQPQQPTVAPRQVVPIPADIQRQLPTQADTTLSVPYPEAAQSAAPQPNATVPPSPANPPAPPQPTESANLAAQLQQLNAPPSTKDALLRAVMAFAPTAISGAFGGLPAAAGAAQGVNTELHAESAQRERQQQSLIEQVRAARQMEQQQGQFNETLGLNRQKAAQDLTTDRERIAAENTRAANVQSGENSRLQTTIQNRPNPNSPAAIAAKIEEERQKRLLPPAALAPIPGRDVPLPEAVARQREAITAAGKTPPSGDIKDVTLPNGTAGLVRVGKDNSVTPIAMPEGLKAGKPAQVPAAIKTQASAAMTALRQVDNIEAIVKANPQLVGPITGRFEQFMQGVGSNPLAGTKDERLGAALAEHLNALFAQELRSMFPGRTNEQMQELIKSTSAQLKQNPNILFGMLDGIRRNEGMVLETAKQLGFDDGSGKPAGGPSEALIQANIKANPGMTRQQVIDELKK